MAADPPRPGTRPRRETGFTTGVNALLGAIAGLIMFVPFIFFGSFVAVILLGFGRGAPAFVFGFLLFFILVIAAIYTVAFSAVGGFLGGYLEREL